MSEQVWHKSSYSAGAQNCVEVAEGRTTGIRDTQNRELAAVNVPAHEWAALLTSVTSR